MPVPIEIRSVPRPPHTVVIDTGHPGLKRYIVRETIPRNSELTGSKNPSTGHIIGYICGDFIPKIKKCASDGPKFLSYGAVAFVKSVIDDIKNDLLKVFDIKEAFTIIAIAMIRIIKPGITVRRIQCEYRRTFVSIFYPNLALSKNTIYDFLYRLGQDVEKRSSFFISRINSMCKTHHLIIDGVLVQDNSTVNDLSKWSYKSRIKGIEYISIIYAFDLENKEPICAQVFPGNCTDSSAYRQFIIDNNITKGIIIADKGFPPGQIKFEVNIYQDLHFITPIRMNDRRIKKYDMLHLSSVLKNNNKKILYKKCSIGNNRFLYSFQDTELEAIENKNYIKKLDLNNSFDEIDYYKHKEKFGVIVFESDKNLEPEDVYKCYHDRWIIELLFKTYKNNLDLDASYVQSDFSVIGSEFINYISVIATSRMIKKAEENNLLDKISFKDLIDDLSSSWRLINSPEKPKTDDGHWINTLKKVFKELEALGLSEPIPSTPAAKRGRPKKKPEFVGPKRKRGRPRKCKDVATESPSPSECSQETEEKPSPSKSKEAAGTLSSPSNGEGATDGAIPRPV